MVVPSSPIHKKPTLGLDLQGGLEITKQAVPPKGRKLTKEDLEPLGHDHARPRRPPRRLRAGDPHAGQRTRSRSSCRASRIPRRPRRSSARRRSSSSTTSRRASCRRRSTSTGTRSPRAQRLRPARRPAGDRQGQVRPVVGLRQEEEARRRPGLDEGGGAREVRRQAARRLQALRHPERHRRDLVRRAGRSSARASARRPGTRTTSSSTTPPAVPQMTGADLKLSGTRQDFDTQTNQPIVLARVHEEGQRPLPGDHARRVRARQAPQRAAALRDRARPRDPLVAADRLHRRHARRRHLRATPRSPASATIQEAKDLALVLQTGALPVEFVTLDQTAISATLGKDSLERGQEGGDRRPLPRRALPARLLPLPRPHRGARPRHLRRLPLRRDPHLQRDADPPGLRRPRADAGGGRRRERRHLRTHQGRGARRAQHPGRDPDRLHEGLRTRSSTPTSSPRSPRSCCSRSPPRRCADSRSCS